MLQLLSDPVLMSFRDKYMNILDTYVRRLLELGVVSGTLGTLHKNRILMQYKEYQAEASKGKK